jgi:general secretion pathway protein J
MRARSWPFVAPQRGFTLIELLVAISLMAVMAVLSWRGLDGMTRSQSRLQQHGNEVQALQAALAQWGVDLDAMAIQPQTPSLDWDGRALRIVRHGVLPGEGLRVVAWTRRNVGLTSSNDPTGQWLRWQSPPLTTRVALLQAWQQAADWGQYVSAADAQREVRLVPLSQWQIFYYRQDAWSNPLSSAGTPATTTTPTDGQGAQAPVQGKPDALPDGIRLVLQLAPGQAVSGQLTRDWIRPGVGGGK